MAAEIGGRRVKSQRSLSTSLVYTDQIHTLAKKEEYLVGVLHSPNMFVSRPALAPTFRAKECMASESGPSLIAKPFGHEHV